jgi:phosphatidylserine decarboxylase
VTPPTLTETRLWRYEAGETTLEKGDEMGRFNMGSTIIVLFGQDKVRWNADLTAGKAVKLGELLGHSQL